VCSFALGPGSYMPARETFEPARRMIPSKVGLVSPLQLPSTVMLLCHPPPPSFYFSQPKFCANYVKDRSPGQLNLVREYKHLDGVSPLPDVPSTITCTSKAFAPGGEHGAYYLNEPRSQAKFAKDRNFSIVRISDVKGSRQCTNVQLAIVAMGTVSTSNWELYPVPLPTTSNKQGPSKKPEGGRISSEARTSAFLCRYRIAFSASRPHKPTTHLKTKIPETDSNIDNEPGRTWSHQ